MWGERLEVGAKGNKISGIVRQSSIILWKTFFALKMKPVVLQNENNCLGYRGMVRESKPNFKFYFNWKGR